CLATGLLHTHGQTERTKACRYYAEQGFAHPFCVGMHYFEMNDQPVLGRFDGECMQHGLISMFNKPYAGLTHTFTYFAGRLYPLLCGHLEPTETTGEIIES
ncbi:MAG: beta-galactosidase, partial [Clostridia bacterium]